MKALITLAVLLSLVTGCRSNKSVITNNFTAGKNVVVKKSGTKVHENLAADKDYSDLLNGTEAAVGPLSRTGGSTGNNAPTAPATAPAE